MVDINAYSAQELHELGEKLREEDKLEKAIDALTLAIVKYGIAKDYKGLADALQSRFLTWKHLYLQSHKRDYLKLAYDDVKTSLFTAKRKNIREILAGSYFRMGEYYMLKGFWRKASYYFRKAILFHKGKLAQKGVYRQHLGEALFKSGKVREGKEMVLRGLEEIEKGRNKIDSFTYHVWKSGTLLKLAGIFSQEDLDLSKKYYLEARKVINSDKRLVIRKRQLEEIEKKLKF